MLHVFSMSPSSSFLDHSSPSYACTLSDYTHTHLSSVHTYSLHMLTPSSSASKGPDVQNLYNKGLPKIRGPAQPPSPSAHIAPVTVSFPSSRVAPPRPPYGLPLPDNTDSQANRSSSPSVPPGRQNTPVDMFGVPLFPYPSASSRLELPSPPSRSVSPATTSTDASPSSLYVIHPSDNEDDIMQDVPSFPENENDNDNGNGNGQGQGQSDDADDEGGIDEDLEDEVSSREGIEGWKEEAGHWDGDDEGGDDVCSWTFISRAENLDLSGILDEAWG